MADPGKFYDTNAKRLMEQYEAVSAEDVHGWMLDLLPDKAATILDVGAGSGRDAAWLAERGHDVVAVEPSSEMRAAAAIQHPNPAIRWIDDSLPGLPFVSRSGLSFEVILLSAVWMHVPKRDRPRAFRKLINLLKPGGVLAITLRCGRLESERGIYPISLQEIAELTRGHGAYIEKQSEERDLFGREDIQWINVAVRLPDDGSGALPLLRHVILNDDKSSTYKLALLRTLCRVADGSAGYARESADDFVSLPLGLIALTWLRLFKPLLSARLPQNPKNIGLTNLGFVKPAYQKLVNVSHLDLRVGMKFSGDEGRHLHQALKDAAVTIRRMPANYITYQSGEPVLPVTKGSRINPPSTVHLDEAYLASFGEMRVPRNLWRTLQSYSAWVEPAIIAEWQRHIRAYAARQDIVIQESVLGAAMIWDDPARDVRTARERAKHAVAKRQLFCVWSGRKLNSQNLDIDHCVPWTVWPCGDLWNLMPTHRTVNQNEKRALLPSDKLLRSAEERVLDWWGSAYVDAKPTISERFWTEAKSSLPSVATTETQLGDVLDAVLMQMLRLRHDQQVPVWSGDRYL